jgi:arginine decarboxylase
LPKKILLNIKSSIGGGHDMAGTNEASLNPWVPKKVFLTKGVGIHAERLNSFEEALRDARISPMNLVMVSSIVPPHCGLMGLEEGLKLLSPGQITFCVMSRCDSDEDGRLLASSVALLLPENGDDYGYISEFHCYGKKQEEVEDWVCDQAAELYASAKGFKINWKRAWSEEDSKYTLEQRRYSPEAVVSFAQGMRGKWVTTLAAAVFVL